MQSVSSLLLLSAHCWPFLRQGSWLQVLVGNCRFGGMAASWTVCVWGGLCVFVAASRSACLHCVCSEGGEVCVPSFGAGQLASASLAARRKQQCRQCLNRKKYVAFTAVDETWHLDSPDVWLPQDTRAALCMQLAALQCANGFDVYRLSLHCMTAAG